MVTRLNVVALSMAILGFAAGCTTGVVGGKPQLPLSDKNGTGHVFSSNESEIGAAITNTFADLRYRQMFLKQAGDFDLIQGWHSTNGFVLEPFGAPPSITNVPLNRVGNRKMPYVAYFHLEITPVGTNQTKVRVRTISSEVIDGKETFNVHGGMANHYRKVPPVRQEEENVLSAIAEELAKEQRSRPPDKTPLPIGRP